MSSSPAASRPSSVCSALAACATETRPTAQRPSAAAASMLAVSRAYGLFLAGQAAIDGGQAATRPAISPRRGAADGGDAAFLQTQAFTAALLAGDVATGRRPAPHRSGRPTPRSGIWLRSTSRSKTWPRATAKGPHHLGQPLARRYNVAAALLAPSPRPRPATPRRRSPPVDRGDPVGAFFANLDQGKLFERLGRYDEAETAFRALIATRRPRRHRQPRSGRDARAPRTAGGRRGDLRPGPRPGPTTRRSSPAARAPPPAHGAAAALPSLRRPPPRP